MTGQGPWRHDRGMDLPMDLARALAWLGTSPAPYPALTDSSPISAGGC